jgi:hypothetical protein
MITWVNLGSILIQNLQGLVEDGALFTGQIEPEALAFVRVFLLFNGSGHEAQGVFQVGILAEAAAFPEG